MVDKHEKKSRSVVTVRERSYNQDLKRYHKKLCNLLGYDPDEKKRMESQPQIKPKISMSQRLTNMKQFQNGTVNLNKNSDSIKVSKYLNSIKFPGKLDNAIGIEIDQDLPFSQQLQELNSQIRQLNLKSRKSSERPPKHDDWTRDKTQQKLKNCKDFVLDKVQEDPNFIDPLKARIVYNQLQPSPLRCSIRNLRVQKDLKKKNPSKDQELAQAKLDLINDYVSMYRKELINENKEMEIKITKCLMTETSNKIRQSQRFEKRKQLNLLRQSMLSGQNLKRTQSSIISHQQQAYQSTYETQNSLQNIQIFDRVPSQNSVRTFLSQKINEVDRRYRNKSSRTEELLTSLLESTDQQVEKEAAVYDHKLNQHQLLVKSRSSHHDLLFSCPCPNKTHVYCQCRRSVQRDHNIIDKEELYKKFDRIVEEGSTVQFLKSKLHKNEQESYKQGKLKDWELAETLSCYFKRKQKSISNSFQSNVNQIQRFEQKTQFYEDKANRIKLQIKLNKQELKLQQRKQRIIQMQQEIAKANQSIRR